MDLKYFRSNLCFLYTVTLNTQNSYNKKKIIQKQKKIRKTLVCEIT